ncbi:unnamed protein product [Cylicocyclus nassatus]|uniref:Uncharacterized protein n=1 Tax=Cylicocyclus nassatus TaxID=53992 RepID=A0AA36HD89_CYLNA|nr:unnamed protein product [Cylicocyclus nassatus]
MSVIGFRRAPVHQPLASQADHFNKKPAALPTNHAYQDGKTLRVPIDAVATEELLDKWMNQAVSGLMAAVTSSRLDQMDLDDREEVHRCSKSASTVPEHAKCVVKVLDKTRPVRKAKIIEGKPILKKKKIMGTTTKRVKSRAKKKLQLKMIMNSQRYKNSKRVPSKWFGSARTIRTKRAVQNKIYKFQIVSRSSYTIPTPDDDTIFSRIAKQLTKTVRKFKNKEGFEGWRDAIQRIKKVKKEVSQEKKHRLALKKRLRQMIDNTPDEFQDPRKPLAMKAMDIEDERTYEQKKMVKKKREEIRIPMRLVRESIKMALMAAGKNVTNFDKKTLKLISPRFLSVVPEQDDQDLFNLLSPSLFSLHQDGGEFEKAMSLPHLLKQLPSKDQEAWMDFIVEAAGVSDAVEIVEKKHKEQREKEMRSEDGTPLYFTKKNVTEIFGDVEKRKIETFEALDKSYTPEQKHDLDKLGYAFLNSKQLDVVYGENSPYNKTDSLKMFKRMRRLRDDPHSVVEHDIRLLAEAEKFRVRQKDIVSSPFVLTPLTFASTPLSNAFVVLSPLVLSPITLSPAVLGPIILSPWVFVPLVLSPRVLAPLIVNPIIFSPIILSPLVLHPLILVPGIFNPLVLSPLVLSPLILSPQVFTPLILSPMVLNPLILTPMAGSPLILSPFVLSPIIYSPQFLFALVLSPYALSPLVESKLIASEYQITVSVRCAINGYDDVEIDVKNSPYYKNGVFNVPMTEESGNELYQHWVDQAFSSLMAAVATERLPKVSTTEKEKHYKCAKKADDVETHAKCVSMLLEAHAEEAKQTRWAKLFGKRRVANRKLRRKSIAPKFSSKPRKSVKIGFKKLIRKKSKKKSGRKKKDQRRSGFRTSRHKREVINRSTYNLTDERDRTPFGQIAKHLTKTIRVLKNKRTHKNWQSVVSEIKKEADEMENKRRAEEVIKKRIKFFSKSAVDYGKRTNKYKKLGKLRRLDELEKALQPERYTQMDYLKREYKKKQKRLTPMEKAIYEPIKMVRSEKSIRMISPRMMSLVPEDENATSNEVNLLSPSLFSLHGKGKGVEKMTSLTTLLNSTGLLKEQDQHEWMDFIIETSGAGDAIEKAKVRKQKEAAKTDITKVRGPDGQPIYLTKENVTKIYGKHEASKIELFERLQKSFTPEQLQQMNSTGYAVLSPQQRELVYGASSPLNNSMALHGMRNVTEENAHRAVRDTVRHVAAGKLRYEVHGGVVKLNVVQSRRQKREAIVLSPLSNVLILNDPELASSQIILSPVQFSALINSPAVFGAIVLSPWLFIPVILSPRLLSPVILTPFAFVPIILSPLALVPIILSPGIMNPFVLSPLVLSPFILSPQVMTPLILSPFALNPFIGTPNVLSPLILSPFVLSPLIFSPAYVSALVLSPYAFSPVLNSTGAIFTSVASPSFLS